MASLMVGFGVKAQVFSLDVSPMIGRHFNSDIQADRTGRIGLSIAGRVKVSSRLNMGVEILWTSRIRSPV
ncbi:MAG: hypothetical protein ACKO96_30170 [Flammeovirgaceae bacterium]